MKIGFIWLLTLLTLFTTIGCQESVPLGREQFTKLLVEVHMTDALLSEGKRNNMRLTDRKNYSFYADLFDQYGIDRDIFDTCVSYYSRNTSLFDEIYKDVIDSLNKRLTVVRRELAELKKNDSLDILHAPDTVWINHLKADTLITISNLKSGKYMFEIGMCLDSMIDVLPGKVISYFLRNYNKDTIYYVDSVWYKKHYMRLDSILNEGGNTIRVDSLFSYEKRRDSFLIKESRVRVDTFNVRSIALAADTNFHKYSWVYFVGTSFDTFVTNFIINESLDTIPPYSGYIANIKLYKQYVSDTEKQELNRDFERKGKNSISLGSQLELVNRESILLQDTLQ